MMKFLYAAIFLVSNLNAGEPFGFVEMKKEEQQIHFTIIGSFHEGAMAILKLLDENGAEQIGELRQIEIYDGKFLIGGIYRTQHGVFTLLMISDLHIDPGPIIQRLIQDEGKSLTAKPIRFINEFGNNDALFLQVYEKFKTNVDDKYRSHISTREQIRSLVSFQIDLMVTRLLDEARKQRGDE